jgi:P-type Ca2+ transporter type 2C
VTTMSEPVGTRSAGDPPGGRGTPESAQAGVEDGTSPAWRPEPSRIDTCRPSEVLSLLGTREGGLTDAEAAARLAVVGPNHLLTDPPPRLLRRFVANLSHLMALLLWAAGVLALFADLPQLAIAVWAVNLLNGGFSTWQEFRAERAVQALRRLLPHEARVLRDGLERRVDAESLVPGDVLLLAEGDRVSADARVVESHELRVDQSSLTGESRAVRRTAAPGEPVPPGTTGRRPPAERVNGVFAGTTVSSGRGKAVVAATGMATEFGTIAGLTRATEQELSPLQRELVTVTHTVGVIAITMGLAFFALAQVMTPMPLATGLVFALGMIVAFVPEGLLPSVTLALAMATQRMARRRALVKRLSSVETLGSTTVICTDKTGTLTANQMTVRVLVQGDERFEVTGTGYDPSGTILRDGAETVPSTDLLELLRSGALANDARLAPRGGGSGHGEEAVVAGDAPPLVPGVAPPLVAGDAPPVVGDPTEAALLVAAVKAGLDLDDERTVRPRVSEVPFDADRKRMSTVHAEPAGLVLRCKGAPRELLDRCSRIRVSGEDLVLDEAARARILAHNDELSREAMRVLAVAVRTLPPGADRWHAAELEQDLTLLGLVGMLDPPRPTVTEAVATCHRAGIRILMITGDYGVTAESIARRIGLVAPGEPIRIVNGSELDGLDDEELREVVGGSVLFARATPAQKLRVVTALQEDGEVVAVTGDGVNDAPALRRADIGIAMGASGTDVAREAADMVLLDDDFATIVAAVEEGRAVYANVRKFTGYIFTSNTPEVVPFVIFGLSGGVVPIALGVMHILAVDLGTDIVPALALGAERPEPGIMDRPPRSRREHLITPALLRRSYLWLGPAQAAIVMGAFFLAYHAMGAWTGLGALPDEGPVYAAATAAALAAVVTTQIGNLFAHRTDRRSVLEVGLSTNRFAWGAIATELALIAAIVYLPPVQAVIGTAAFPAWLWLPLFAATPTLLAIDEGRKALLRRRVRRQEVTS